jgi:hypothetical protein
MLSHSTVTSLIDAGWSPDRRVQINHWVEQLTAEGYTMHDHVKDILEKYGGLVVKPVRGAHASGYIATELDFDPVYAGSGEFDRVDYWQQRLGLLLSPLGEHGDGGLVLLANDGGVFRCRDDHILYMGSTFEEALENTLVNVTRQPDYIGSMHDQGF